MHLHLLMISSGWYHYESHSDLAAWAQAIGVFAAVLVALFQDWIRARFWRVDLSVRRTPDRASFHKTRAQFNTPNATGYVPVFYYRLEVHNAGNIAARNVEVFLRAAYRLASDDGRTTVDRFVPEWLAWTTLRNVDPPHQLYLPVLAPGTGRYFDLAHVLEPKGRQLLTDEVDPAVGEGETILSLDVPIRYLRLGHLLPPGRYTLALEVAAANAKPRAFEVDVTNSGWFEEEEELLAHGVMVNAVRPT